MEHFNRIFEVKVRVLGSGHPEVAHLQLQMAEIARSQGKLEQALDHFKNAYRLAPKRPTPPPLIVERVA